MTPGPWFVDRRRDGDVNVLEILTIRGSDVVIVASVCAENEIGVDEREDAKAIAALPTLIAAFGKIDCACSVKERDSGHGIECWMPEVRAALVEAGVLKK